MYDSNFVCTYQHLNDNEADDLYKVQFLQAFRLDDWNDKQVGDEIDMLYANMKDLQVIKCGISKLRNNKTSQYSLFCTDDETTFRVLFGFDLFYLMHKCICEFSNHAMISDDTCEALLNKL